MKMFLLVLPVLSGVLWGSVGIFVRELNAFGMDRATVLSSRMIVAATILLIGILIYNKNLLQIKLKDIWIFIASGILGMLGLNFCYNEAINQLTLSLAAILLSLSPLFVMFFAAILFKEKITTKKIGCIFIAIIGCVLASGILENTFGTNFTPTGIVIGLAAAFFYALYSIFSKIAMEKGYCTFTIIFYSILTLTVALLPFTNWQTFGGFIQTAPFSHSIFMILHSLCTSVLPYIFYTISLLHIETGKASILAAGGEPIAAVIFGVLFFSETPTILTLLGLVITIIALALLCLPSKTKNKLETPNKMVT